MSRKVLLLVSIFFVLLFFLRPVPANAIFNCTGTATSYWNSYGACQYPFGIATCPAPNRINVSTACTQDYSTGTCGGCLVNSIYQSCNVVNSNCSYSNTSIANDSECGGGTGHFWTTTGCGITCSGIYYCDASCNEYYTHLTGSGAGTACTSNGALYASNTSDCSGFWGHSCPINATVNGVCDATHYNCTAGTPAGNDGSMDTATQYKWSCTGSNGGNTASCSENKPVSATCSAPAPASCDANGNVTGVAFGIATNLGPWIQSVGGDIYQANGINNVMPAQGNVPAACGGPNGHMSIASAPAIAQPGIIFSGLDQINFGVGDASVRNWVAVDNVRSKLKTSYEYLSSLVKAAGTTPVDLSSLCADLSNCTLPANLTKGVYLANGNLTLGQGSPSTYTFPTNNNYVFLVNGDLTLATEIHLPHSSTAIFAAAGNIHVDKTIGTAVPTDNTANIEGYFSADKSFILDSYGPNNCPATPDNKLNMEGAIIANAIYDTSGSKGTLQVKRDMCAGDVCPTLSVKARLDFVLNAPLLYQFSKNIEEEVAP